MLNSVLVMFKRSLHSTCR